jgi:hypothetical protein
LDLDQSRDSLLSNSDDGDHNYGEHSATQSPFSPFSPSAAVNDSRYDDDDSLASPQPQPVAANLSTRFSYGGAGPSASVSSSGGGSGGKKIRALVGLQVR